MLPIGPLMIEHRLIERMIALLRKELTRIEAEKNINARLLDDALDFIQIYGDRLHHGKEEDILFAELDKKDLTGEHRRILKELLDEHRQSRKAIEGLAQAKERYLAGNTDALSGIVQNVRFVVDLYPVHIDKEDHHFFVPCMKYFSPEEKDSMLVREHEFDRELIHILYKEKVVREENRLAGTTTIEK